MNLLHYACECCSYYVCKYLLSLNLYDLRAKDNILKFILFYEIFFLII